MKTVGINLVVFLAWSGLALAQNNPAAFVPGTWTTVTTPPAGLAHCMLLTDATVACHSPSSEFWFRLTPDSSGNYATGKWTALPSFPNNTQGVPYRPLYYASAVLPTGQVVAVGGEYQNGVNTHTNRGAILDFDQTVWTELDCLVIANGSLGDVQSVVLPNGTFMIAGLGINNGATLAPPYTSPYVTHTTIGHLDSYNEEGWVLLPNNLVMTVLDNAEPGAQVYDSSTNTWTSAGNVTGNEVGCCGGEELGPMVLRPDGTVITFGASDINSIYNGGTSWTAAPNTPGGLGVIDGPAALLPNGNVLVGEGPANPEFTAPTTFFEFAASTSTTCNPNTFCLTNPEINASVNPTFVGNMVGLPTGQILYTDFSNVVQIYTQNPANGTYQAAWRPTISSVATTLFAGSKNNPISGTQFNGLSQANGYGDDNQQATNYPLVRFTQIYANSIPQPTRITYGKTHDHSTMAVATGTATVSTQFDIPAGLTPTVYCLQVVANGIPSTCTYVTVKPSTNSNTN